MPNVNDELISWITENVAMTGSKGRTMDDLWSLLTTQTNHTSSIENLWRLITFELEFTLSTPTDQTSHKAIPAANLRNSTYDSTKAKFGMPLRWTATPNDQTHYLLRDQQITLPPLQRTVLERIGSSGESGVPQCVITAELDLKPQTIFHHLKKLQSLELIRKTPSIYQGQYTNTCVHTHYSESVDDKDVISQTTGQILTPITPDGSIRYDVTAERMNQLLLQAKDNMMALSDLVRLTGFTHNKHMKWARHFLAKQHTEGSVEKIIVSANGKKNIYVRLIKPISIADGKADSPTPSNNDHDLSEDTRPSSRQQTSPLTVDIIASYIASKNGNGCTNKDIFEAFPNTSKSTINGLIKKLKGDKNYDLVVIKELQQRSHVYCYFTKDGFQQYQRTKNGSPTMVSTTQLVDNDETGCNEGDLQAEALSTTAIERKRKSTSPSLLIETTLKRNKVDATTDGSTKSVDMNDSPSIHGNVNVTLTRRKTALLDIIRRDKIRDFNVQLFDEIQTMDGTNTKHKLARRTAQRLVDGLEKQGLLRLIKIVPKDLFGGSQPRTLVLSPELDASHQLVKDYLDHKQNESMVPATRLASSTNTINNNSSGSSSDDQPLRVIHTSVTRYGRGRYTVNEPSVCFEKYWRYIAKRHGWIESKWLRGKELHLFLVKLLLHKHGAIHENEQQRAIPLIDMITMMPFDVYKKVVGIHQYDEVLEAYVETNQAPTLTLADIPDDVKRRIIPNPYQMRRRILGLLAILENLDLIRPSIPAPSTQSGNIASSPPTASNKIAYIFQLNSAIRNYILPDRPILAVKPLTSVELVIDFWNELQYTCVCVYGSESDTTTTTTTTTNRKTKRAGDNDNDPLSTITLSRTWANGDIITAEQKQSLDQHVNYSLRQVPTSEWALFLQLSRTTGLLPYRIRSYYLNLGNAFAKRNQLEQQQRSAEELEHEINQQASVSSTNKYQRKRHPLNTSTPLLLRASKENQRLSQVPDTIRQYTAAFSAPTFVGSRSFRRTYVKDLDESAARKDQTTGKRTIQGFTTTEKSTFLYAMAIMRQRKHQGNKFYWAPMTQVIPTKSIRQCTSHFHSLSATSLRKIDDLQQKWGRIYTRGLEANEISDNRPWDTKDYDLAGYLEYFLQQLLLNNDSPPTVSTGIHLPSHSDALHTISKATPKPHSTDAQDHPDDSTSHTMGNTLRISSIFSDKDRSLARAIQLIKMIMVHPEESFDSHSAYSLLSQCSADTMEKAYLYLKNAGVVVLSKHGDTRRVPGRKFRMSNDFILSLSGPITRELYEAAFDFDQRIVNGQQIPKRLDDGMMVSLLNLISQQMITIYNQASDLLMESLSSPNYPKPNRFHGEFIEQWIDKRINLCIRINETVSLAAKPNPTVTLGKQSIEMISSLEAQEYLKTQPLKSVRRVKSIYNALDGFGANGASSMELKSKLKRLQVHCSDQDILVSLQTLMRHIPSLVVRVGYDDLRWICVPHAESWMSKLPTTSDAERDTFVQVNMWTHLDGTTNQNMLYACGSSLLGYILRKPGITQDQLEYIFRDNMSRAECQQVLDLLLEHDIIYTHSTAKQQRASLFSKPTLMYIKPSIISSTTTSYFATSDYYRKLNSLKGKH